MLVETTCLASAPWPAVTQGVEALVERWQVQGEPENMGESLIADADRQEAIPAVRDPGIALDP